MKIPFAEKIRNIIKESGYDCKVRAFTKNRDYVHLVVYAGRNIESINSRRSRKLVVFKNLKGEWEGEKDYLEDKEWMSQYATGSSVYLLDYHDKTEPLKYDIFSDIWKEDGEEFSKNKLLKILATWKMCETEIKKLTEKSL